MSDIKIEDNLLSDSELRMVQDLFGPSDSSNQIQYKLGIIPWSLTNVVKGGNNYQLAYVLYQSSDPENLVIHYAQQNKLLFPMFFAKMQPKGLLRVKANLQMSTSEIIEQDFHCDYPLSYTGVNTSIFYINSNDGYTEFEDGTRIESVANRLVTFPLNMKHRGTTCTDKPFRLVINFNYF